MGRIATLAAGMFVAFAMCSAAPASAEPLPPYCERVPILGVDPHVRTICDQPIGEDGSWIRARLSHYQQRGRSTCDGYLYQGGQCPPWRDKDVIPERYVEDEYRVTWDTIPPGEPGHLG